MNNLFNWCVDLLYKLSHIFGITYEEINVIIFVFIYPFLCLFLLFYINRLKLLIKDLKKENLKFKIK
jgi:hypothetical protein